MHGGTGWMELHRVEWIRARLMLVQLRNFCVLSQKPISSTIESKVRIMCKVKLYLKRLIHRGTPLTFQYVNEMSTQFWSSTRF